MWLCACTVVRARAMCMGVGRRCRLLPAFSTHSASPQVACCEMSVAEKLKISLSSSCSLLGLMGLWGPSRPLGPWWEEELLDEGQGVG